MTSPLPACRASRACSAPGVLLLVGLAACSGVEAPGDVLAAGQPLQGGTASPQVVTLSGGQRRALGAFFANGVPFCTGWLAAARHVVTAGHCFPAATHLDGVDFVVQVEGGAPLVLPLVAVTQHPTLDVSVVLLGADALGAEPVPVNVDPLSAAELGKPVEVAGAGVGTNPALGISFGIFSVRAVEAERITIDAEAPRGPCRGDSGGPYLMDFEGSVRVVALESEGAADCQGPNWGVRTDVFAAWLAELVATPFTADSSPCGADSARCDGAVQWQCRSGWWRTRDCAAYGASCGSLGPAVGEGCLPPACGDIDTRGQCQAGQALWCSGGHVERLDCAARDLGCAFEAQAGGVRCVPCAACAGECVDVLADPRHCGACGTSCSVEHGASGCQQGVCVVNGCDEGFELQGGHCGLTAVEARAENQETPVENQGLSCGVTGDGPWLAACGLVWATRLRRGSSRRGAQS